MSSGPVTFQSLFDETGPGRTELDELGKSIAALTKGIRGLSKNLDNDAARIGAGLAAIVQNTQALRDKAAALTVTTEAERAGLAALGQQVSQLAQQQQQALAAQKGLDTVRRQATEADKAATSELRKLQTELKAAYAANDAERIVRAAKSIQGLKQQTEELNRALRGANSAYTATAGSFRAMENEARQLDQQLKALGTGMQADSAEAQQLKARLAEVNQAIITFTQDVNQGYKNVGRYAQSIIEAVGVLEKQKTALLANSQALATQARATNLSREQQDRLQAEIQQTDAELGKVNSQLRNYGVGVQKSGGLTAGLGQNMQGLVQSFAGAYYGIQGVATALQQVFEKNVQYSDAAADVAKTTNATKEEVDALATSLKGLDTRTSLADLLDIAKVGGQLGYAKEELLDFVKATDVLNQALGDDFKGNAEQVATEVGKIGAVYRKELGPDVAQNLLAIGSAINELGAVGSATAPVISGVLLDVGAGASTFKVGIQNVAAYAAVLEEAGVKQDVIGSSLSRLFSTLGNKTEEAFRIAKKANPALTLKEFTKLVNTDFNAAIQVFLKGLTAGNATTTQVNKRLSTLKLTSGDAKNAILSLSENLDLFAQRQQTASDQLREATSLSEEAKKKNDNLAGSWNKLTNDVGNFFTSGTAGNVLKFLVDSTRSLYSNTIGDVFRGIGNGIEYLGEKTGLTTKTQTDYTLAIVSNTQALTKQAAAQQTLLTSYTKLSQTSTRSSAQELELAQLRNTLIKQFGTDEAAVIQASIDNQQKRVQANKVGLEIDLLHYNDFVSKTQALTAKLQEDANTAQAAFSKFGLDAAGQKNLQDAARSSALANALAGRTFPKEQLEAAKELNRTQDALAVSTARLAEEQKRRAAILAALAKLTVKATKDQTKATDDDVEADKKKKKAVADVIKEEAALAKQRLEERLADLTRQADNPANTEAVRADALKKAAAIRIQIARVERDELIHEARLKYADQIGGEQALGVATTRLTEAFSAKRLGIERETNKALVALHNALLDQLAAIDRLVIETELDTLDRTAANEQLSYQERQQAALDASARRIELIQIEADTERRAAKGNAEQLRAIQVKEEKATAAELLKTRHNNADILNEELEKGYLNAQVALERSRASGAITEREYTEQMRTLNATYHEQRRVNFEKDATKQKEALEQEKANTKEATDFKIAEEQRLRQLRGELINAGLDQLRGFSDAYFTIESDTNAAVLENLQHQKEAELLVAGDNLALKAQVEEKFRRKELEAKRKQAQQDKQQAEFNVILNTAQAVTAVLSTGGGTKFADFGISAAILSAAVVAQGLAQLIAIESRPLPNYFKGRRGGPAEIAVVGEQGPELLGQPGSFRLAAREGIAQLAAGDRVYTAPETRDVLRDHELVAGRLVARRQQADQEQQTASLRGVNANRATQEAHAAQLVRHDTERLLAAAARIEQAIRAIPKTRFVDGSEMEYIEHAQGQIAMQRARYHNRG